MDLDKGGEGMDLEGMGELNIRDLDEGGDRRVTTNK